MCKCDGNYLVVKAGVHNKLLCADCGKYVKMASKKELEFLMLKDKIENK